MTRYAIVGASIAGVVAAETIRQSDPAGEILLIDRDNALPYDKPALSKSFLSQQLDPQQIHLRPSDHYARHRIDLHLGTEIKALEASKMELEAHKNGATTALGPLDAVIVATGCRPRQLPGAERFQNIHQLRTLQDATQVRSALTAGSRLLIVGAGFIGLELASVARELQVAVTVVEPEPIPLARIIGDEAALWLQKHHQRNGVRFLNGTVTELLGSTSSATHAVLSTGDVVRFDTVVVGIGVVPTTDWLASSGIKLDNGITCDEFLHTSRRGVFAAGDVAHWHNSAYRRSMRIEHFDTARRQGQAAGNNAVAWTRSAPLRPYSEVPYVWSDQYELKIQLVGWTAGSTFARRLDAAAGKLIMEYSDENEVLTGILAVGMPGYIMKARRNFEIGLASPSP